MRTKARSPLYGQREFFHIILTLYQTLQTIHVDISLRYSLFETALLPLG